jgi:ATP-dependent Clp protease ATP-binding subunit ClpA
LHAQLASIRFDANDDESIRAAIRTVEDEIDRRLLPFKAIDVVAEIASQFKAKAAENIRLRPND